ncbi:MAG: hypothetical protein GPJ54_05760, partial [Candidatus Heimdallarchaeota archaeon]|nr:hypothetical protein [Candidatus Heimdallarchaeota archaeon]
EVKLVIMQLGRKLKTYLGRSRRRQREKQRKSRFDRFAPETVNNLLSILEKEGDWNRSTGVSPSRIIAALSSGIPRIDSSILPPSSSIWGQPIWAQQETVSKLQANNIFEVSTFFRTSDTKLAKILKITEAEIDVVKRRTISELDKLRAVPKLDPSIIVNAATEKRFTGKDEKGKDISIPRLSRSLPRRWIRNSYDYIVSPPDHLQRVQSLAMKLVEFERSAVITKLYDEPVKTELVDELSSLLASGTLGDASDLKELEGLDSFFDAMDEPEIEEPETKEIVAAAAIETLAEMEQTKPKADEIVKINILELLPHFESFFELPELKKRKVTTLIEFLFETTHPINPINEKILASSLISNFKSQLSGMVDVFQEYGDIKVSVAGQDWIDGYLRNAFKRRKINTVNDIIKADDGVLFEIGELQRLLFTSLMGTLIPSEGKITETDYLTENATEKIAILRKAGIKTVEELAATPSDVIVSDKKYAKFVTLLIEESKDKIIEYLTMSNSLGELNLIKEISSEIELQLDEAEIANPVELYLKYPEIKDKATKERARYLITQAGFNFEGLPKNFVSALDELEVYALDQIVLAPNRYLSKKINPEIRKIIESGLGTLMLPPELISPNLIPSANLLVDAGVTTIGKFLVWPSVELARITNYTEEWLNLLKQTFDSKDYTENKLTNIATLTSVAHLIGEENVNSLKFWGFDSISGICQIKWGDVFPENLAYWSKIAKLNQLIVSDIEILSDLIIEKKLKKTFDKIEEDFRSKGIVTILDFLRSTESTLLAMLSNKSKKTNFENFYRELSTSTSKIIDRNSDLYHAILAYRAIERIKSPVVYMSEFEPREIDMLTSQGIKTLNQMILTPQSEIATFLKTTQNIVSNKIEKSILQTGGREIGIRDTSSKMKPVITFEFDGIEYFTNDDLQALYSNGYNTLESIYYIADPRTFEVAGLNWEIVNLFKKLLRSPPVLISWKRKVQKLKEKPVEAIDDSDLYTTPSGIERASIKKDQMQIPELEYIEVDHYYTLTTNELDNLGKKNINRVIDFATADVEDLAKILSWEVETVIERQQTIILQEVGINLSDLEIFRQDHLDHLKELGLETIEDLYFTTSPEGWESEILPYEPIQTIKNIVNLELNNVVAELGDDIVELLINNEVKTILDLLLTGDQILEQRTGLPAERFENLKFALDFGALIEAFDKSILFTPGLLFHQANTLIKNKITRIIDLLVGKPSKIAKILGIDNKEAKLIIEGINRTSVLLSEEERGVPLRDLNVFSRSDLRSVAKSGIFEMNEIDTLQELLYQVAPNIFQGEDYVLQQVVDLQAICRIPFSKISDLNREEVELLNSQGIHTIADTLLISFDDLPTNDPRVNEALNYVSVSIKDLSPFVAMAKLPAHVVQKSEDTRVLINVWLDNSDELHERSIRNIRSLLCMPIRLTSYYKSYTGNRSEIVDKTFADLLLEYAPEGHPNSLLINELKTQGSLIKLLREGSSPITSLDLEANSFRSLLENGFSSMEKIILVDDKRLSTISNMSQKYWKSIKENFDPESSLTQLKNMGIRLNNLALSSDEFAELEEKDLEYVDQISVYLQPEGVIAKIHKFIFSSTLFLIGTPGEKEIAENMGSRNIIEAILSLRKHGANHELIVEMVTLAWTAYSQNFVVLPKNIVDTCEDLKIYSMQDLVTYVSHNSPVKKDLTTVAATYAKSVLLLSLPSDDLIELMQVNRCSSIIEALTTPMNMGKIIKIRKQIKESGELIIENQLELDTKIISKLSKQLHNRLADSQLSLQDIIASPRTADTYKGIKQKFLGELRLLLKIPLSRLYNDLIQLPTHLEVFQKIMRLDELILYYPVIYREDKKMGEQLREWLHSDSLIVIKDLEIPKEAQLAAETAMNIPVTGFHELWTATWQGATSISNMDNKPAKYIKQLISNSSHSVLSIKELRANEYWGLYNSNVYCLSDIILTPEKIISANPNFTKKRVLEVISLAMKAIIDGVADPSINIREICGVFGVDKFTQTETSIVVLKTSNRHPLLPEIVIDKDMENFLLAPIGLTDIANNMKFEDLKILLKLGIVNLLDLFNYPEKMPQLPKKYSSLNQRLDLIKKSEKTVDQELELNNFSLPTEITNQVLHENKISNFVSQVLQINNYEWFRKLEFPLSYTSMEANKIAILSKNGINSTFDLFIAPIGNIVSLLGDTKETYLNFLTKINFENLQETVSNVPLQISTIEVISKSGLEILSKHNFFSLLDIRDKVPSGLNRNDELQINNYIQILNSDSSLMLQSPLFPFNDYIKLKDDMGMNLVRDIFNSRHELSKDQRDLLDNFTPKKLIELRDNASKFSMLELLSINDEKILVKNGVFTFIQLQQTGIDELLQMKIAAAKAEEIPYILGVGWQNVEGLSENTRSTVSSVKVQTVAELLSLKLQLDLPEKISIIKPIELKQFYSDLALPNILIDNQILTLGDVLETNKGMKLYKKGDNDLLILISFLHQSIRKIPKISNKWIPKLERNNIIRVWQYLNTDSAILAGFCSSSSKAQDEQKQNISITTILKKVKLTFSTATPEDGEILLSHGLFSASEMNSVGLLSKYLDTDKAASGIISKYVTLVGMEIYKLQSFWDLPKIDKWKLAAKYKLIRDVFLENPKLGSNLLKSALKQEFINEVKLGKWIDAAAFKNYTVHQFAYEYYGGRLDDNTSLLQKLLVPLDIIPSLQALHIISGYESEITTVLDLLLVSAEGTAIKRLLLNESLHQKVIDEIGTLESVRTPIPKLGIVSSSIQVSLNEAGFYSWNQVLGKFTEEEFYGIKGITLKTVNSIVESTNIPITQFLELRALGLKTMKKLVKSGVNTVFDLILVNSKLKNILGKNLESILINLTKSNLNKGGKHSESKLSLSRKIKIADVSKYNELGVRSPTDILVGFKIDTKDLELIDGIEDWKSLGTIEIKELNTTPVIIDKFNKGGFKSLDELIITPDSVLKSIGLSNKEINEFNNSLFLPSKRPKRSGSKTTSKKVTKKATAGKKTKKKKPTNKKTTSKTTKKKAKKKAKKKVKKKVKKKSTSKKAGKKKKSTKKRTKKKVKR